MAIFSLKAKLLTLLLIAVAIFGTINLILFHTILLKGLTDMLNREGKILSSLFSEEVVPLILSNDVSGTTNLGNQFIKQNPDVIYVVVYDSSGNHFTSTFENGIPEFLKDCKKNNSKTMFYKSGKIFFQDVEAPILGGSWGYIHIGFSEDGIRKSIKKGDAILLIMVIIFFLIGSAGSILISSHISSGARGIVDAMDAFKIEGGIPKLPTNRRDEIGIIAKNLEDTFLRLQGLYREHQGLLMRMRELDRLTMVGLLASGLSHEINNPISALSASIERISKDPSNAAQVSSYTEPMKDAVSHIKNVLSNLLSFVRRKKNFECYADINDAIKKVEILMGSHLKSSKVLLKVEVTGKLPLIVFDPVQIVQVLINLIFNSTQALPQGGIIKLRVENTLSNIQIEVEDNGEGMDEGTLKRAFDPLFTTRSHEGGTGLGLAICKTLVEEHGGIIDIKSKKGIGTVVRLKLKKIGDNECES